MYYDATTILAALTPLVGYRQNEDPNGTQVSELITSSSGLWFNDAHPVLTTDNLIAISPDTAAITYNAWNAGTSYVVGDIVTSSGTLYIATASNTNDVPPSGNWSVYSPFSIWLREITESLILKSIRSWFNLKIIQGTATPLLENRKLYQSSGNISDLDTNYADLVGLELVPIRSESYRLHISSIGLQFDTAETKTVYLFKSNSTAPLQTLSAAYTGSGSLEWFDVDWDLDGDGVYYIAYDQGVITGQSVNGARDYFRYKAAQSNYPKSKFFQANPFRVNSDGSALWDIQTNSYTNDTNWGINLQLSVSCDYTQLIVDQKDVFADLIQLEVAQHFIRKLAFNPNVRVNRNQSNIQTEKLLYELDGDSQGRDRGLRKEYEKTLQATTLDFSNVDKLCLPCRKRGSSWRLA